MNLEMIEYMLKNFGLSDEEKERLEFHRDYFRALFNKKATNVSRNRYNYSNATIKHLESRKHK